jgi:hypothetical protein
LCLVTEQGPKAFDLGRERIGPPPFLLGPLPLLLRAPPFLLGLLLLLLCVLTLPFGCSSRRANSADFSSR